MAADVYTLATQLAVLLAGRTPVWSVQDNAGSNAPPASPTAGTPLQGAARTEVHVSLRIDAHHRSALLTIPTPVLSGTYTATIAGHAVTFDATGALSRAAILDGLAAAINANGTVNTIVAATSFAASGTGPHDSLALRGLAEADYSIDFGHSGAAVVAVLADYASATGRLWWLPGARAGSTAPTVWASDGDTYSLDQRGRTQRYDSAGYDRLFVQLTSRTSVVGDGGGVTYNAPVVSVGPCLLETDG